jgi:hypothetical protein
LSFSGPEINGIELNSPAACGICRLRGALRLQSQAETQEIGRVLLLEHSCAARASTSDGNSR